MTGVSFVLIGVAMAGVFALFWWLVELTGGVAGHGLSVCRSMQTGFVSWRESRGEPPPLEPPWTNEVSATGESFDEGLAVPIERVQGRPTRQRS